MCSVQKYKMLLLIQNEWSHFYNHKGNRKYLSTCVCVCVCMFVCACVVPQRGFLENWLTVGHVLTTTCGYYQFSESTSLFAGNVNIKTTQYVCFQLFREKTECDLTRSANGGLLIPILFLTSNLHRDTLAMLTFLSLAARSRTQLNRGLRLTQLQITIKGGERGIQRREWMLQKQRWDSLCRLRYGEKSKSAGSHRVSLNGVRASWGIMHFPSLAPGAPSITAGEETLCPHSDYHWSMLMTLLADYLS